MKLDLVEIEQEFYCGFSAGRLNMVSFIKESNTTNESVLMRKAQLGVEYNSIEITDDSLSDARSFYRVVRSLNQKNGREDIFITGNKLYDLGIDNYSKLKNQNDLNAYFYEVLKPMKDFIGGRDAVDDSKILTNGIHATLSSGIPFAVVVAALALGINVTIYVAKGNIMDNIFGDYVEYDKDELLCIIADSVDRLVNENYFFEENPRVC